MLNQLKSTLQQISTWLLDERKTAEEPKEISNQQTLNIHLVILLCVFLSVFLTNFPFSSFFSGWDNLHPEFNLLLNLKRGFAYVFQANQGLGTFGGHGYSATLPHTLVIWVMSLVTPVMFARSIFTFLMLLAGSLGVFFLTHKIIGSTRKIAYTASLIGALYYMLNFATVQNFYAQLESFIIHFGALPWLVLSLINYLERPSRRNLIYYIILIFFGGSMGFIPPLFIVYLIIMGIYCGSYFFSKPSLSRFSKCLVLGFITLGVNAYWILPLFYYTLSGSTSYINAYNNLASTTDFILKNKKFGSLRHLALLRGFLVEQFDTIGDKLVLIAWNWRQHLSRISVEASGYVLFALSLVGAGKLFFKPKWYQVATAIGFLVTFTFLATDTRILHFVTDILQNFSIYKQAFRIAFTKFSISVAFFYSLAIGVGIMAVLSRIQAFVPVGKKRASVFIASCLVALCLLFFTYPIFDGNFLYSRAKTTIPNQYFELFDYLKTVPRDERILNAPVGWNWGWTIYKWGYTGSGLLWYGAEQPIVDRTFDVWESSNENLYWELSNSMFSENFDKTKQLLDKYQIDWVLFDENVVPYPNVKAYKYSSQFKKNLLSSGNFQVVKTFTDPLNLSAPLYLVKVIHPNNIPGQKLSLLSGETLNIGPYVKWINNDTAFSGYNTYITDSKQPYDVYIPFRSLFTGRKTDERYFGVEQDNEGALTFLARLSVDIRDFDANTGNVQLSEPAFINASIKSGKTSLISVRLSKSDTPAVYNSYFDTNFLNHKATDCGSNSAGLFEQPSTNDKTLKFVSRNSDNCYDIALPELTHDKAYLISVAHKHLQGKPMQFALINHLSNRADIDVSLSENSEFDTDYFVIPPGKSDGIGYSLHFNSNSIGQYFTENELGDIQVYEMPYEYLTTLSFVNRNKATRKPTLAYFYSFHKEFRAYAISSDSMLDKFLPFLSGTRLENHYRVNNWANGWEADCSLIDCNQSQFVIIFWPQYLQYVGFGVVLIALLFVIIKKDGSKKLNHTPININ